MSASAGMPSLSDRCPFRAAPSEASQDQGTSEAEKQEKTKTRDGSCRAIRLSPMVTGWLANLNFGVSWPGNSVVARNCGRLSCSGNRDLTFTVHSCSQRPKLLTKLCRRREISPRVAECAMPTSAFGQPARLQPLRRRVCSLGLLLPANSLQPST